MCVWVLCACMCDDEQSEFTQSKHVTLFFFSLSICTSIKPEVNLIALGRSRFFRHRSQPSRAIFAPYAQNYEAMMRSVRRKKSTFAPRFCKGDFDG